jgi:hypothetical protein
MTAEDIKINFNAPASLRKWASIRNERNADTTGPYLLHDGTLVECLEELLSKPVSQHHLYEIHTDAQEPWIKAVISVQHVYELVRLRKLLTL